MKYWEKPEHIERRTGHRRHLKTLMEANKMICGICGKKIKCYYDTTIDHILARRFGGSNKIDNLQLAHKICNQKKSRKEQKLGGDF